MSAYYNEFDPFAAAWLRELIADGLIAPGDVDERDIRKVQPDELRSYTQVHLFAGIGGWSRALRLAGWPDDRPVWTGSCPCQDFSSCGDQAGFEGDRDMWPEWIRLIGARRPKSLFGEQVDDSLEWYDRTAADLEALDYSVSAVNLPACAIGRPQERLRLYFSAHAAALNGQSHDRLGPSTEGRTQTQFGRLSSMQVAGRWWNKNGWPERLPTLVRNFNGLSKILGGFGNAIVPEIAAAFIQAFVDISN